jgi:hypothetical protein
MGKAMTLRCRAALLLGLAFCVATIIPALPTGATGSPTGVSGAAIAREQALVRPTAPFPGAATFRLFATREGLVGGTTANGHVIGERDRFVALPSRLALAKKDGYDKQVLIAYKGKQAVAPVWDVGPWNTKDNYWDAPEVRQTGKGLPRGWPAAQAQFFDRYSGGISDKGYTVANPAGIDIADGTFWDDLQMTGSDWVDVTFLWLSPGGAYVTQPLPAGVRNSIQPFAATNERRYFAESGHSLAEPFKGYWEQHGGLAQFGYPLTEAFRETSIDDGKPYTVQYFERARFEAHPEAKDPQYQVQLGFLGKAFRNPAAPTGARAGARFFAETGHNLGGSFRIYWEQNGGLAIYGLPISEELRETSPTDGREYTVQYFERARFEAHPENAAPYSVLLGQLGRQLLDIRGAFTK